uniref:Apple domain-containing protein n=1 Tax=Kwoniella bestiolae CBS 10118 TaxID=1296100 RepID=A0A1B9GCH8_9TREE|nr:hypothetical protein I302_00214 [Kwoniella bestiolae CBS 10118]OCF28725.1 hypothetical protein I302_00214 [Kwoniella bestiolae CBS 10118]
MIRSSSTPLLLVLGLVYASVAYGYTFVGCTNVVNPTTGDPAAISVANAALCNNYCAPTADSAPYFYYNVQSQSCVCTSQAPTAAIYPTGGASDNAGNCNSGYATAYKLATTFTFTNCDGSADPSSSVTYYVNTPGECFTSCRTYGQAFFSVYRQNNQFTCLCAASSTPYASNNDPRNCGSAGWFRYYHSAESSASGLARRQLREKLDMAKKERQRSERFCPRGLTACAVEGWDSYECIDTSSELESCGGCVFGEYGSSYNSTSVGTE